MGLAPVGGRELTIRGAQARWNREELRDPKLQPSLGGNFRNNILSPMESSARGL